MGNYLIEIKKAKEQFDQGNYRLCSIQCGMIIESSLKFIFKKYVNEGKIKLQIPYKNKSLDRLTFGELITLCEHTNILSIYENDRKVNRNGFKLILNRLIINIRNDANHELRRDQEIEIEAGAHIIYGSLLLLQKAGFFLEKDGTVGTIKESMSKIVSIPEDTKPPEVTPTLPPKQIVKEKKSITVCKNISTKIYSILLSNIDEKMLILISPNDRIMTLSSSLFEPPEEKTIHELTRDHLITHKMLKLYLRKKGDYSDHKKTTKNSNHSLGEIFEYRVLNAKAKMVITQGGLYSVLKGSTAIREDKNSIPENAKKKRKDLIQSGVLVDYMRGLLIFTKDVEFKSPAAASCIISGTSTNGWICFKDRSGKTLKQHDGIKS
jgi:hypothetical protein